MTASSNPPELHQQYLVGPETRPIREKAAGLQGIGDVCNSTVPHAIKPGRRFYGNFG